MTASKTDGATLREHCELGVSVQMAFDTICAALAFADSLMPRDCVLYQKLLKMHEDLIELKCELDWRMQNDPPADALGVGPRLNRVYYCDHVVDPRLERLHELRRLAGSLESDIREEATT